jgi:hypothetical protein
MKYLSRVKSKHKGEVLETNQGQVLVCHQQKFKSELKVILLKVGMVKASFKSELNVD